MLRAPAAAQRASTSNKQLCDQAKTLQQLYNDRDESARQLSTARSARPQNAGQVDNLKATLDTKNKQIDDAKARYDALAKASGDIFCDETCVKQKAQQCAPISQADRAAVSKAPRAPADAPQSSPPPPRAASSFQRDAEVRANDLVSPPPVTVPTPGISWQTAFVTGLAQFLSDRGQQEVVLWLTSQFENDICNNPTIAPYFPETCTLLDPDCGYGASPPSTVLAAAIRADIEGLPVQILVKAVGLNEAPAKAIVQLFVNMRDGHSPLELIAGWSENADLASACGGGSDPLSCGMIIVGAIVLNAGDVVNGGAASISAETVTAVINEADNIISAQCRPGSTCTKLDPNSPTDRGNVKTLLVAIVNLVQTIDQVGKSSASATDKAVTVLDAVKQVIDASTPFFPAGSLDKVAGTGAASPQGVQIGAALDDTMDATTAMLTGQYAEGVRKLVALVRDVAGQSLPDPVPRYLGLFVDLSNAKTAADVQTALQNAAEPVGSWRNKRQTPFNASITGLVGIAGGYEQPLSTGSGARKGSLTGGMMGAVGIDLSWGIPPNKFTSTAGLFLSVLDVGQLLTLPIAPSTTSSSKAVAGTNFQLVQVFSPGAHLRFGLGNTPFVLGAGAAIAPQLRLYEPTAGSGTSSKDLFSMVRFNAFLAVDVTILPISRSTPITPSTATAKP